VKLQVIFWGKTPREKLKKWKMCIYVFFRNKSVYQDCHLISGTTPDSWRVGENYQASHEWIWHFFPDGSRFFVMLFAVKWWKNKILAQKAWKVQTFWRRHRFFQWIACKTWTCCYMSRTTFFLCKMNFLRAKKACWIPWIVCKTHCLWKIVHFSFCWDFLL